MQSNGITTLGNPVSACKGSLRTAFFHACPGAQRDFQEIKSAIGIRNQDEIMGFSGKENEMFKREAVYCDKCRARETEVYGKVLNLPNKEHRQACIDAGCKHTRYRL